MGKVTISSDEYAKLLKGNPGKKAKTKSNKPQGEGHEARLKRELTDLYAKKTELDKKVAAAKQRKGFLAKTGLAIGVASQKAQLNKAINERRQLLGALGQRKNLEVKRDILKIRGEISDEQQKIREAQKARQKKFNEDIFNTDDIFKI